MRYGSTTLKSAVGAFLCMVVGPNSGLTICKTHPDKTLHPTPFLVPSAISKRLGFGMRLARIPYPSARHPYSALCPPPLTGLARAVGGRGSPFARLLGHARHRGFIPGALRSSCMSALFTVLRPSPGAYPRGGRVRCYSAEREAGTPLVSWGSCAPGPQGSSSSYNTSPRLQRPARNNKSGDGKGRGAKPQKHSPGPKRNDLKERLRGLQGIMHMRRVVLSRTSPYVNNHS
jgi:hypothetical protein